MEKKRLGYISGELWRDIALEAASSGRQFGSVVEEALRKYLRDRESSKLTGVWLSPELVGRLDAAASNRGMSVPLLTSLAIEAYIGEQA